MIIATVTGNMLVISDEESTIRTIRIKTAGVDTAAWSGLIVRAGFSIQGQWVFRGSDGDQYQPGQIGTEDGPQSADCVVERFSESPVDAAMRGTPAGYSWHLTRVNQRRQPMQYQIRCAAGLAASVDLVANGRWAVQYYGQYDTGNTLYFNTDDRAMCSVNLRFASSSS